LPIQAHQAETRVRVKHGARGGVQATSALFVGDADNMSFEALTNHAVDGPMLRMIDVVSKVSEHFTLKMLFRNKPVSGRQETARAGNLLQYGC
jgi:hypothetical protein